jgi:ATP-dependent DNA helicase DinG
VNRFVVIDLETTGNSPKKGDKIIQLAAVVIEDGLITETFSTFLNPNQSIPPFIEQLTGINDEMVKYAPRFDEIAPKLIAMLEDSYFVAHNVLFDLGFLQEELRMINCELFLGPILDTVEMSRILFPTLSGYRLSQLAETFQFNHDRPHQADSDALVTAEILLILLEKLENLPLVTLKKLMKLSANFTGDLFEIIEDIIRKKGTKSNGDSFDIFRGIALKKVTNKVNHESGIGAPINYSIIRETYITKIKEGNLFSASDFRQQQMQMMDIIQQALQGHTHALIEAGTGLGKSVAYLIPATLHSLHSKRPLVISTFTIQLQQQLMERDIPILNKIFEQKINAVIVKGKDHYISLPKFEQAMNEADDNYDSNLSKAKILVWLTETETGDIEEVNLPSGGHFLWERISLDHSAFSHNDPWKTRCFYERMKQKAISASLIITNHALLCRDIFNGGILPLYQEIIIDEGHHFEETVSDYLGRYLDYISISFTLGRIGTISEGGLLSRLSKHIQRNSSLKSSLTSLQEKSIYLKEEFDDLFRMLRTYVLQHSDRNKVDSGRISYRFSTEREEGYKWSAIIDCVQRIRFSIFEAISVMESILEQFSREENLAEKSNNILSELTKILNRFNEWRDDLKQLFLLTNDNMTTWMEVDEKGALNATYIYQHYVKVEDILADTLFAKKQSVILTSATLTIQQSFDYMIRRLGLTDFQPLCEMIGSPFDYNKQARLLIPTDLPNIKAVENEEFIQAIAMHIATIAKLTNGRMLVLFTSLEMLKSTYYVIKEQYNLDGFSLIAQGISSGSRTKITKNFLQFDKSILFGTSSFWEGIDLPGDSLTCLVIVRLPFVSPEQPLFSAKAVEIDRSGGNSFIELSLPLAILRFKQGFGRLIRSKNDKGAVFVLDKRIVTTWYGKTFIQSLPDVKVQQGPLSTLLKDLKNWLYKT